MSRISKANTIMNIGILLEEMKDEMVKSNVKLSFYFYEDEDYPINVLPQSMLLRAYYWLMDIYNTEYQELKTWLQHQPKHFWENVEAWKLVEMPEYIKCKKFRTVLRLKMNSPQREAFFHKGERDKIFKILKKEEKRLEKEEKKRAKEERKKNGDLERTRKQITKTRADVSKHDQD